MNYTSYDILPAFIYNKCCIMQRLRLLDLGGEEDSMLRIEELQPITQPSELAVAIGGLDPQAPKPLLTQLGGGVLRFSEAVFPDIDRDRVYAQKFIREFTGKGAHFDVYNDFVDEEHPLIGVYNLTGHAVLRAVALSQDLQEYYDKQYPHPTDEAFERRKQVGDLTLSEPGITVMEGKIEPGIGMIFPQFRLGRHLVHDVVPTKSEVGSFIKLAVPKNESTATKELKSRGYEPFSQFVEEQCRYPAVPKRRIPTSVTTTPRQPCTID